MSPRALRVLLAIALWTAACAGGPGGPQSDSRARSDGFLPDVSHGAPRPSHVLVVTVSGLSPAAYRGTPSLMPTVAALAARGAEADAVRGVAPATKHPAHATLVTGRRPAAHGIVADFLLGERGVRLASYSHASLLKVPTLWQAAVEEGRQVAALGWPTTLGASIPLLIPDVGLVRPDQDWLAMLSDAATPELLPLLRAAGGEAPDAGRAGPTRDAVLVGVACSLLASASPPGLLLLHLSQTEPALAASGLDSDVSRRAFRTADAQIGRLIACLRDAQRLEASALVVAGDHGTLPVHTLLTPNGALADDRLLIRSSTGASVEAWSAIARSNGGSAFVYAANRKAAVQARRTLSAEAERTGAFRIVSAEEMLAGGADPDAWFGLEAEPGYVFGDAPIAPATRAAARRAVGGYLPGRREMDAGFVAWGRGVRSGIRIPVMRQIDVAPTLARLLVLPLPDPEGRTMVGMLRPEFGSRKD